MARFLTPLRMEQVGIDRVRLLAPLRYESDLLKATVTVRTGFLTDLESVPRWLPFSYALLRGMASAPAVVHDWLYQLQQLGISRGIVRILTRAEADAVLYEAAGASGPGIEPISVLKRWHLWLGVRLGGGRAWQTGPERLRIWDQRATPR